MGIWDKGVGSSGCMTRSLGWGSAGNGWNGGSLLLWESALFFLRAG